MKKIYYALTDRIYGKGFDAGVEVGIDVAKHFTIKWLREQQHDTMVTSVNSTKPAKHDDKLCRLCKIIKSAEENL